MPFGRPYTVAERRDNALRELAARLPRAGVAECMQKLAAGDDLTVYRASALSCAFERLDHVAKLRDAERNQLDTDLCNALYEIRRRAAEAEIEFLIHKI